MGFFLPTASTIAAPIDDTEPTVSVETTDPVAVVEDVTQPSATETISDPSDPVDPVTTRGDAQLQTPTPEPTTEKSQEPSPVLTELQDPPMEAQIIEDAQISDIAELESMFGPGRRRKQAN